MAQAASSEATKRTTGAVPTPARMAHIVLRTYDMPRLRDWYCAVFGMEAVAENEKLAFATFDDEHHRFGFAEIEGGPGATFPQPGTFAHAAYAFADLGDLLAQYKHMRALGFTPLKAVNHGVTVSIYYNDPDGNGVEFFTDRFATPAESRAFMTSETFRKNLFGYFIDPEELLAQWEAGVPDDEILAYDQEKADRHEYDPVRMAQERAAAQGQRPRE
ncbi:MAG: VOC family protein [Microbacteriaceae bacterium]